MRRLFALSVFVSLCFVIYALMRVNRVVEFRGAAHLWEVLLQKDVVMIDILQYIPLFVGLLLGIVQFVPEMLQKRLKLTLHLPYSQNRMILLMLGMGGMMLGVLFLFNYLVLGSYLYLMLAPELVMRILLTALPWYIAGFTAYLFTAWICLEPGWRGRIVAALMAVGVLRIFFLSDVPQANDSMLWLFLAYTAGIVCLPFLSVRRFRDGRED